MYGVLKSTTNTGLDSELQYVFSTPLQVISRQPVFASDTLSLKHRVNSQKVQRWEITAQIAQTNDSSGFLVHSVVNGMDTPFPLRMPQVYSPVKLSQTLALTMTATALVGASSINITGLGAVDLTGQFISFAGNNKVYLVTSKGVSGANIGIAPALITNIASTTAIITGDKVTMMAYYDLDTQLGIQYDDGVLVNNGAVKYIEAL